MKLIRFFLQPLPPKALSSPVFYFYTHMGGPPFSLTLYSHPFYPYLSWQSNVLVSHLFHCEPHFWIDDVLQRFSKTHQILYLKIQPPLPCVCLFSFVFLFFCFFSAIADVLPLCHNLSFPFQEKQNSLTWTWQAKLMKLNKSAIIRLMVISFVVNHLSTTILISPIYHSWKLLCLLEDTIKHKSSNGSPVFQYE